MSDVEYPSDTSWYAVMTKPGAEERVAGQIHDRLGREVYLPRIQVKIKRGRSLVLAVRPLFPTYIFARLLIPQEWHVITYTRGARKILGGWDDPYPVAEEIIEFIKSREQEKDRLIQYYNFQPQERVAVKHGPLRDLYGIFDRYMDGRGRVRVLLQVMGCQAAAIIDAAFLEKA